MNNTKSDVIKLTPEQERQRRLELLTEVMYRRGIKVVVSDDNSKITYIHIVSGEVVFEHDYLHQ